MFGYFGNEWWSFLDGFWVQTKFPVDSFCTGQMVGFYELAKGWYSSNTSDSKLRDQRLVRLTTILGKLRNADQRRHVLEEMSVIFSSSQHGKGGNHFGDLLNNKRGLLAFKSGIYDFATQCLREFQSGDYISLSVGYDLPDEVDTVVRTDILNFIKSIMATDEDVRYLLKWGASCLVGYNHDELFTVWTGKGRNGKGVLAQLFEAALNNTTGGYMSTLQSTLLNTERPGSASPSPDLLNMRGKRLVMTSEPEKSKPIKGAVLKWLSGNDAISGRAMYGREMVTFKPQYQLVLQCNDIPELDADDEAIWMRSRFIQFPFQFVDSPTKEHERPIDKSLKTKVSMWGPQFAKLLLE
ncbi:hypothetical protein BCR33DRAFT_740382 [Rhizoclosmatium globosum]|uniref:SF3 helicase domain-containing protein n=1 Tax=Rhizoclosmatium globosum TaxID=329046 RepID=A0A1Y2C0L3_9FUNG|nr:hypothetical protein BCR33DRAFT_740382 [Rhizoclosmatium globosum]|eukprot:ORY40559.1 hypothetical protein BCR33DRAFT_740382 [Rhizoclosmatium globosum]